MMKRSKNAISPSIGSPKTKNKKRCKEPSPPLDSVTTPETKPSSNTNRTSGGISKSLLTPCRRMGLNRNRNKALSNPVQENKSPLSSKNSNSAIPRSIDKSSNSDDAKHRVLPLEKTTVLKMNSSNDINLNNENIAVKPQALNIGCNDINDGDSIKPAELKQSCIEIVNKKIGTKNISKKLPPKSKELEKKPSKTAISSSVKSNLSTECTVSLVKEKELNKNTILLKSDDSCESSQKSSSSYVSDDEDDFENKTIIERKCYKNPPKNSSKLKMNKLKKVDITDNDIEDIKRRIKQKQDKLEIIGKTGDSQGHSIEELEKLIVSWRGGCRKALEELLNISKEKGNFKENMSMEELLNMLNIPFELVKYNSEQMLFE